MLCGSTVALAGEHCSYEDAAIVIRDWNHVYESGDRSAVLMRFSDVITEKYERYNTGLGVMKIFIEQEKNYCKLSAK